MTNDFHQRLPLSRHATDRAAHRRTEADLIPTLLADPRTRILVIHEGRTAFQPDSSGASSLRSFTASELAGVLDLTTLEFLFLGETTVDAEGEPTGTSYLAVGIDTVDREQLHGDATSWRDLRTSSHVLSDRDAGLFTQSLALLNWHRSHTHSPRSGVMTSAGQAGWVRHDPADESHQVFPRTDPAIIVLVTDGADRILLGNNALWEPTRYSLLAGYVEPGESLEAAVIREVYEEAGLVVTNPVYRGSQPWPFPASLMLGFTAQLVDGEDPEAHAADGEEIRHLRWFTREEVLSPTDEVIFPGPASIARALLEEWLGEPLEQSIPWVGIQK